MMEVRVELPKKGDSWAVPGALDLNATLLKISLETLNLNNSIAALFFFFFNFSYTIEELEKL